MPCTPARSTWSAVANASSMLMPRSLISSSRSFGTTMRVSTSFLRVATPSSACACAALALEAERLGDDTDGERADRLGDARDDRRATGSGAAALARGDEDHVGPGEGLLDLLRVVLCGASADLGIRAGAEAARELASDVELDVGVAHQQRLGIGVDGDELDAAQAEFDHAVDGVDAAAADADDLDHCEIVLVRCHVRPPGGTLNLYLKFKVLLILCSLSRYGRPVGCRGPACGVSREPDQYRRKTAQSGADDVVLARPLRLKSMQLGEAPPP